MLDQRNARVAGDILTLEDPIEFLFKNKKSIVNQREIGTDTESLEVALKNALRQSPDVIFIGEIRDPRDHDCRAGLRPVRVTSCLATLHANNSHQALNRILSFYPVEARDTLLGDLAAALKVVVSQRLLRTVEGVLTPAVEILLERQAGGRFDCPRRPVRRQRGAGAVHGRRFAVVRAGHRPAHPRGRGGAQRGPGPRRLAHQPDVASAKRLRPSRQAVRAQVEEPEVAFTEITLDVKR